MGEIWGLRELEHVDVLAVGRGGAVDLHHGLRGQRGVGVGGLARGIGLQG